jgi:hypothetical protein
VCNRFGSLYERAAGNNEVPMDEDVENNVTTSFNNRRINTYYENVELS